jgi:diguanylate cyclase (GGDEF)-like protein
MFDSIDRGASENRVEIAVKHHGGSQVSICGAWRRVVSSNATMREEPDDTGIPTLAPELIGAWAEHRLIRSAGPELPRLTAVFRDILWTAQQYIPSESGSICLSGISGSDETLVYVAAFGSGAGIIIGRCLPVTQGITGRVFREGRAELHNAPRKDRDFYAAFDDLSDYTTRTLLAVPVAVAGETVGVIGLFNRLGDEGFREEDRKLLEVLSGYASNSLLNLADAFHHREAARRDDLTGLRNDRFFHHQLRIELERREEKDDELSLVFLDLDRFKAVVDAHGHLVGSQVISEVGQLIGRLVTDPRATLARYGGDEFVAILPGLTASEAVATAESVRGAIAATTFLSEPGEDGRPALHLKGAFSASIGIASYRECGFPEGPPADWRVRQRDFIEIADQAMYRAKAEGRDRVCLGGAN